MEVVDLDGAPLGRPALYLTKTSQRTALTGNGPIYEVRTQRSPTSRDTDPGWVPGAPFWSGCVVE
jgi:hypothetical protein